MKKINFINTFLIMFLTTLFSKAAVDNLPKGALAGSCTMQISGDFKVQHNSAIDKNGSPLPAVPAGMGGATWPISYCPEKGTNMDVKCITGWKPVVQSLSQMVCGPNCFTYWATYQCAKTAD